MIRKVLIGAICWTLLISLLHLQLNVGWARFASNVRVMLGQEREQMLVGFLPVT